MLMRITRLVRRCVSWARRLPLLINNLIPSGPVSSLAACSLACAVATAHGAETTSRSYDIPRGGAVETLRRFAEISGRQVVYLTDAVRQVTTNPVRGEFTAREALAHLIANTGLVVAEDGKSGALMVNPAAAEDPATAQGENHLSPQSHVRPENYPMKKTSLLGVIGTWIALSLTPGQAQTTAGADKTGILQGRVLNERNAQYLEGARISIEGTALSTVTEADGSYRLSQVPAGAVKVQTFYTGLPRDVRTAEVGTGRITELNITLGADTARDGVVQLGRFQVSTSREMDASALSLIHI
jgi:hypothetical protein